MVEISEPQRSPSDLEALYRWLNVPRFVIPLVCGSLLAALGAYGVLDFDPRPALYIAVPAILTVAAGWEVLIRKGFTPSWLLLPQLIGDLLAVTAGVALTGGLHSPFVFIYVFVVISASLVSFRMAAAIGAMAVALYLSLGLAEYAGLISRAAGQPAGFGKGDLIQVAIFILLIALIAFQSNFYVSQIRKKDQEILKFKDEFLFRTIHDLRSPSTVLRLILDKYAEPGALERFPPDVRQDIDLLQKATVRMRGLVEDILKVAKGEQGQLEFKKEKLDLSAILRYCLEELGPHMKKKGVTAKYAPQVDLPAVTGDEEKLKEVFNNFVSNAIKYNKEGGTIEVTHRVEGGSLATVIKDSGIGIKKENLAKLFTAYFRGDVDRSIEGTGLGLYFTKKLVEKMGGKIDVDSAVGQGTTFMIFLPVYRGTSYTVISPSTKTGSVSS